MNSIKYMAVVLVVVTMFVPTVLVVMVVVRVRLDLFQPQYSLFGSILTIGAMMGAIVSGQIADYIGRRGTMGFSEIFCLAGWLAIAFSKGAWWLDLGRLLVGCGMGLLSYVVPIYIAEITPKNLRGGFTTVHQLMICCGVSLTYLIGAFVKWRTLALIGKLPCSCPVFLSFEGSFIIRLLLFFFNLGTILCLVQLLGLFFSPESPRWLAKIGQKKECEAAIQHLRGQNADITPEATEIRVNFGLQMSMRI
ncbi:sugar transporter ERD6-like 5 isoform X3 [Quercus robur]|uniref:sugar transporter ERD6-like 5 isoform X3 n=1 Tax=Quercus robur TaxID=38942 RepID=UPI002163EB36|nr:sugar transporter ERD6-like 5 isoform X3 [Quercus robur]